MPKAAALAAIQVPKEIFSLKNNNVRKAVSSGLMLITTSVLAVVVRDRATTNAVNITAHIAPENRPGQPAARTAFRGFFLRKMRIKRKAKRLRQKTCSKGSARSIWRVTTPAVLHSTGAATIRISAVALEMAQA